MTQSTLSRAASAPLIAIGALASLLFAVPAKADYAVLRSTQRLHITGWQMIGETVRLDLQGGSVTIAASDLLAVEPEDIFPANPQPVDLALGVPYAEQIKAAASTYGVDPQLIASVIAVESNFNWRAVSSRYALGLMQLRPDTAVRMGLAPRNIFDPKLNIEAGTRFLKELLSRYAQNLTLVLAAYNAGPERVDQYHGVPPFPETQEYVKRVIARLRSHKASVADALTDSAPH